MDKDKLVGLKIEQYLIESKIGSGKTGAVYKARDLNLDRPVAIKFLASELAIHPAVQQQLAQAARAVSHLTHPSIVALYAFGKQHGRAYMVTDYIKGISLANALLRLNAHSQTMPLDEALHLMTQAADALGAAHQEGALHLNLKPSNLIIKRNHHTTGAGKSSLRLMLTDFGLSLIPETGIQTSYIDLSSNFAYMSPEQCTNGKIDGRSDIYSLGAIFYEILVGQVPFDINTSTEAIMRHAVESPLPLTDLRPDLPPFIAKIAHTALAKDPPERYQLAEHMADALRQAMRMLFAGKDVEETLVLSPGKQTAEKLHTPPLQSNEKPAPADEAGLRHVLRGEQPEQPTSSQIPPSEPIYSSPEYAFSESMPVQPQFDTPVYPQDERQTPAPSVPPFIQTSELKEYGDKPEWLDTPEELFIPTTPPPAPVAEPPTAVHDLPFFDDEQEIIIIRQGRGPRRVKANKPLLSIGRAQDNDVVLNAPDVSRHHLKLEWVDGEWEVTDLDSSGGTIWNGRRLRPHRPEIWQPEMMVQIGSYFLYWSTAGDLKHDVQVTEEQKTELFQVPQDATLVQSSNGRFSVTMHPTLNNLVAGEKSTIQIELFNQGPTTDTLKMAVRGLPSGAYTLTQHLVTLAPGARVLVPLVLHLPASGTLLSFRIAAGNYPFELLIHSKTVEGETAVTSGMLIVSDLEEFSVGVWPTAVDNGDNIRILIRNEGNTVNAYSLVGRDEKGRIQFGGQRGHLQLKPGEAMTQVVTVRTRERPLWGREQEIPFEVAVRTENGQEQVKTASVKVRPQVPGWVLVLGTILFTLLLGILLVTAVSNQGQAQINTPPPPDATPSSLPISDTVDGLTYYHEP